MFAMILGFELVGFLLSNLAGTSLCTRIRHFLDILYCPLGALSVQLIPIGKFSLPSCMKTKHTVFHIHFVWRYVLPRLQSVLLLLLSGQVAMGIQSLLFYATSRPILDQVGTGHIPETSFYIIAQDRYSLHPTNHVDPCITLSWFIGLIHRRSSHIG